MLYCVNIEIGGMAFRAIDWERGHVRLLGKPAHIDRFSYVGPLREDFSTFEAEDDAKASAESIRAQNPGFKVWVSPA